MESDDVTAAGERQRRRRHGEILCYAAGCAIFILSHLTVDNEKIITRSCTLFEPHKPNRRCAEKSIHQTVANLLTFELEIII